MAGAFFLNFCFCSKLKPQGLQYRSLPAMLLSMFSDEQGHKTLGHGNESSRTGQASHGVAVLHILEETQRRLPQASVCDKRDKNAVPSITRQLFRIHHVMTSRALFAGEVVVGS